MHGNVINVLANVNEIQLILPHLPHDDATICVFLKWWLEYKSRNVHPNMVMIASQDLIGTPLYKNLNVITHHQWASLFTLHMDLKFQILNFSDASFDNLIPIMGNYIVHQQTRWYINFWKLQKNGLWKYYVCPKSTFSPSGFI